MSRAKVPVSVAGIEFDALISSDHKLEATVPSYATEKGFTVNDAIIIGNESLSMVLFLTDTPVTWSKKHGVNNGRVNSICTKLEELYYTATPVKIVTTDKTYTDMAIESITISKSTEKGYAREIPISFRKVRITEAKTTTIPAEYGKSGTTQASAGTSSTKKKSTKKKSTKKTKKKTKKKTTTKKTTTSTAKKPGSTGSILHSAGKKAGLIK